jgi:hypothetical protein
MLGGTTVEEEALAAALLTVRAAEAGTLPPRSLAYECVDVLQDAYDRCGVVTEDYGRTFYMGAPRAARRPGRCACQRHQSAPSAPLCGRSRPDAARSHAADDGEETEGHLGHLRCVGTSAPFERSLPLV